VDDGVTALLQFAHHDYSWLVQFFSLLFLPFAHEDLAIVLGAYVVVNKIMPVGLVTLCIYGGMVASDFALYAIGAGARRLPWLARLAVDARVRGFAVMLGRNLFGLMALGRIVPGVVFVASIACGWARVPLGRFAAVSLVVSALYLPLMLCIAIFFGDALDDRVGLLTWPLLVVVVMAMAFFRHRVFGLRETPDEHGAAQPSDALTHQSERTRASAALASAWSRQRPHLRARSRIASRARPVEGPMPSRA
jgi:membrane protein DedA with SNARE-associated domain